MPTQSTLTTCNYLSVCTWRLTKLKCRRKNSWQKTEPPNLNICYCYCDFAFQKMLFSMRNGIAQDIKHNHFLNLQSKRPRMVPTWERPNLYPLYYCILYPVQCDNANKMSNYYTLPINCFTIKTEIIVKYRIITIIPLFIPVQNFSW